MSALRKSAPVTLLDTKEHKEKKQKVAHESNNNNNNNNNNTQFKKRYDANECVFINPHKCVIASPFKKMIFMTDSEWKSRFLRSGSFQCTEADAMYARAIDTVSIEIQQPLTIIGVQQRKSMPYQCYLPPNSPLLATTTTTTGHPYANLGSKKSIENYGKSLVLNNVIPHVAVAVAAETEQEDHHTATSLIDEMEHPHGVKVAQLCGLITKENKETKKEKETDKERSTTKRAILMPSQAQDLVVWVRDKKDLVLPMSIPTWEYCLQNKQINEKNELVSDFGWKLINIVDRTMVIPADWYPSHLRIAVERSLSSCSSS